MKYYHVFFKGLPNTFEFPGMFLFMKLLAPITTELPILTPFCIIVFGPMYELLPT